MIIEIKVVGVASVYMGFLGVSYLSRTGGISLVANQGPRKRAAMIDVIGEAIECMG